MKSLQARTGRGLVLLLLSAGTSACDFPTSLPRFQTRVVIPFEATRLAISQLVPPGVTVTPAGFNVAVPASNSSRTLAQMCGAQCQALQGQQAPKPAFTDMFTVSTLLPADVEAATVTSGTARVTISHTFAYDPLRPPGSTQSGVLRVVARSAGREVGRDSVMAPFTAPITRDIPLTPGAVAGSVALEVTIMSPAGGTVTINNSAGIAVSVQPTNLIASDARVRVQNRQVTAEALTVDLTGVDDDVRDRVQRGTVIVELENPLAVAGELELRLNVPGVLDIRRPAPVAQGTSTVRVELTLEEVRALLGRSVSVQLTGTVSQTAGAVTVLPTHEITITPRINLVVEFGS